MKYMPWLLTTKMYNATASMDEWSLWKVGRNVFNTALQSTTTQKCDPKKATSDWLWHRQIDTPRLKGHHNTLEWAYKLIQMSQFGRRKKIEEMKPKGYCNFFLFIYFFFLKLTSLTNFVTHFLSKNITNLSHINNSRVTAVYFTQQIVLYPTYVMWSKETCHMV